MDGKIDHLKGGGYENSENCQAFHGLEHKLSTLDNKQQKQRQQLITRNNNNNNAARQGTAAAQGVCPERLQLDKSLTSVLGFLSRSRMILAFTTEFAVTGGICSRSGVIKANSSPCTKTKMEQEPSPTLRKNTAVGGSKNS